jgi:glutaredoxin 3
MNLGHVVVWSKPDCPYCYKAKTVLTNAQVPFEEKMLNVDFTREQLLESFPNAKTFPVVVIDGFHIGGYTQLASKLNEEFNNTQKLLNE